MKNLLILIFASLATIANASKSALFHLNDEEIYNEFVELTEIEEQIQSINLSSDNQPNEHQGNMSGITNPPDDYYGSQSALGVPSFLWGCCLGPVGIVITQIMTENIGETKKAVIGCTTSACLVGGCYFLGALQSF